MMAECVQREHLPFYLTNDRIHEKHQKTQKLQICFTDLSSMKNLLPVLTFFTTVTGFKGTLSKFINPGTEGNWH